MDFNIVFTFVIIVKTIISEPLVRNTKQTGYVFKTIQPSGIKMCAKYCSQEKRCKSFNFERESLSCEMLSQEDSANYVDVNGYFHSDISQWPTDVSGNCKNHNCTTDERCVSLRRGGIACVKIGCVAIHYTYDVNSGLCYHIFLEQKSWTDASQFCQNQGGRMIVLDTQAKLDFFPPSEYASYSIYLGLTDMETEGTFKWVDGSTLTNHKWSSQQPNDVHTAHPGESADCAETRNNKWSDDYCGGPYYYACERPDLSLK